jgi:L-methionine (R)-S-oxide reductase
MAETTIDLRGTPLVEAYDELEAQTRAVLEGIDDPIAAMATMSALIHNAFGHLWTGFYRVVEKDRLLRVGPYQGTVGCLEIEFGSGVCGAAAATKQTQIVEDVMTFPGHITCDARSRSEIVVPVFSRDESLIAVLDIDSDQVGAFSGQDRVGLEKLVEWFRRQA